MKRRARIIRAIPAVEMPADEIPAVQKPANQTVAEATTATALYEDRTDEIGAASAGPPLSENEQTPPVAQAEPKPLDTPNAQTASALDAEPAPGGRYQAVRDYDAPVRRAPVPNKAAFIRELKELKDQRAASSGGDKQAAAPVADDKSSNSDKSDLISELAEQARNGGRRNAERVQEEITLHMERFRDKYSDLPI